MEEKKTYWNINIKKKKKVSQRDLKRDVCEINCREVSFVQYFSKQLYLLS